MFKVRDNEKSGFLCVPLYLSNFTGKGCASIGR